MAEREEEGEKKKSKKKEKKSKKETTSDAESAPVLPLEAPPQSLKSLKKGAKKHLKAVGGTMKLKELSKAMLVTVEELKAMVEENPLSFAIEGKKIVYEGGGKEQSEDTIENPAAVAIIATSEPSAPTPSSSSSSAASSFPYPVDPDDHCETPVDAYAHVASLLRQFPPSSQIYDPYYCDGAVVRRLASLGFPNVSNSKVDCYAQWASPAGTPRHDVFLTNPPYSGDHIEKLMRQLCPSPRPQPGERPWFLLMPQFVHKKDFYIKLCGERTPFYLVPKKRYVYLPPDGLREKKKSGTEKKSSPFVSMWFIWGGSKAKNDELMKAWERMERSKGDCELARSKSALRDLRRK